MLSIETSKFTSILAKILQECRDQSKLITLYFVNNINIIVNLEIIITITIPIFHYYKTKVIMLCRNYVENR